MLFACAAPLAAQTPPDAPTTQPTEPPAPAAGDAPLGSSDPVVITANRNPTPVAQLGSSVTVVTGDELRRRQVHPVSDALRGLPGLDVARSGSANQIASVFMRGAESSHTLVLIDGIEANDPTNPNRAFNFAFLTTDDIDRIEVVRGPQGTLWGSGALGGVVNIITKRGQGDPHGYVFGEGGSYHTFRAGAGVSGGNDRVNYSLSLSQTNSDGFSAAGENYGNTEDDAYGNSAAAGKVGVNISEVLDVDFIVRYNHARTDIDDFGGPGGDDPDRKLISNEAFFRIEPHLSLFDGKLIQTYGLSYSYFDRKDNDETFPDDFDGSVAEFELQNDLTIARGHVLTFGLEIAEERFESDAVSTKSQDAFSFFVQDSISFDERLFLTAGLRFDDYSESDSAWTYRLTAAYLFPSSGTKLRASYGTGFKAPSLSNLFSGFGSPDLEPEEVEGFDVGIEQTLLDGRLALEAVYFYNDFDNLIDFDFITSSLQNVGATRTRGVELAATARICDSVRAGINYTYTDALNLDTDRDLLRRPPHKIGATVFWQINPKAEVNVSAAYYGIRADIDPVTFGRTDVDDYVLVNLAGSYRITDNITLTGRIENLLDQDYEEVAGFGTAAISFYGGLRITW